MDEVAAEEAAAEPAANNKTAASKSAAKGGKGKGRGKGKASETEESSEVGGISVIMVCKFVLVLLALATRKQGLRDGGEQ